MFFAESEEYIMVLNDNILKLENEPENIDVVNSMFRAAHSLKGMAATMRFNKLAELTHKMENMMDQIRNKKMQVNTEIIDLLFAGIDYVEEIVKHIKENGNDELDLDDYLAELEAKINEEPNLEDIEEVQEEELEDSNFLALTDDDIRTVNDNKKELDTVFAVNVKLNEETQFKQVRASMIFKSASELGYIFKSIPDTENVEDADLDNDLVQLILISNQSRESINNEFSGITDVEEVEMNKISLEVEDKDKKEKKKKTNKSKSVSSKFEVSSSVRVDIGKLDKLMNMIGELLINKTRLEALNIDSEGFKDVLPQLDRVTMELHHTVMQIRMEPIGVMFNRFPRMIRDLSKSSEKEIDFVMDGKQTELDRSIIDELGDPLTHLLRNAVDHGIEKPEVRRQNGKDETGTVNLRAYQKGSEIMIEVEAYDVNSKAIKAADEMLQTANQLRR
jgi:two-component system chemotaxis sensor kinase CheA